VGFSLTVVPRLVGGQIAVDVYHRATVANDHSLNRDLAKTLLGTAVAAAAVAIVAPLVVNVFYGPEFSEGLPVYLVLMISVIAQGLVQVSYQFTRVYGGPWPTVAYSALGPALMLAASGWALATFGVVGMAWLSSAASVLMAIPAVILARRLARSAEVATL
jgi:O-antigen/teichoic acid export membrane protein